MDDWWGWISISHARTKRHNDVTGQAFCFPYDQPYIVNVVWDRRVFNTWVFGASWRYHTGGPFTPVVGTTTDGTGRVLPVYGELGSERLPDYHSLDLMLGTTVKKNMRNRSYSIHVSNVYNRINVAGYDYNGDYTARKPIEQLPLSLSFGFSMEF